jgi:hypothetical protein
MDNDREYCSCGDTCPNCGKKLIDNKESTQENKDISKKMNLNDVNKLDKRSFTLND